MIGESEVTKLLSNTVIKEETHKQPIAKKCNHEDIKSYYVDWNDNNKLKELIKLQVEKINMKRMPFLVKLWKWRSKR